MWGPTCDGLDCVLPSVSLPNINIGDWLYFNNMGAYTLAAGSTFNGMPRPRVYYVIQEDLWQKLQQLGGEEEEEEKTAEVEKELGIECKEVAEVDNCFLQSEIADTQPDRIFAGQIHSLQPQ